MGLKSIRELSFWEFTALKWTANNAYIDEYEQRTERVCINSSIIVA